MDTIPERFWAKVDRTARCWLWTRATNEGGYGRVQIEGKARAAHRVAWILTNGPIPPGLCVLHTCDTPACVRPSHLFLGTQADNVRDCIAKGRRADIRGERNHRARLSERDVARIRQLRGKRTQQSLADEFGVTRFHISHIQSGKRRGR